MKTLLLVIFIFLLVSCGDLPEEIENTPQDPMAILDAGPDENELLYENSVTFTWHGIYTDSQFQYQLENFETSWSDWSNITTVTFDYLDENGYLMKIKERFSDGEEQQTPTERNFIVDAVSGQSLVMRKQFVDTSVGSNFTVEIMAEEVLDLMGTHITINFNNSVELTNVEEGDFFTSNTLIGTVFITTDIAGANSTGILEIDTSILEGEPNGVDGQGVLAILTFHTLSIGNSNITFDENNCQMRDSVNNSIIVNELINCLVESN